MTPTEHRRVVVDGSLPTVPVPIAEGGATVALEVSHAPDRGASSTRATVADEGPGLTLTPAREGPGAPQMRVLVVTQQFVTLAEWKSGYSAFVKTLGDAWKVASPDFKQQFASNWHEYRKHYLERWQQANPKPAEVLPPDVARILEDWQSLHKKTIPVTRSDIDAAGMLAPCEPTKEELSACRKWHFTTDDPKKPWYRKIGVSLMDCAKNWSKWQSLQDIPQTDVPKKQEEPKLPPRMPTAEELKRMAY